MQEIQTKRKLQQGSLMLEVIAVLALMGVMGAMMFRQIYQRNQELHNVQMASEMRTIKEAFSACIQAQFAELESYCPSPASGSEDIEDCTDDFLYTCIEGYLPEGWFPGGVKGNYKVYLYSYREHDTPTTYYGKVQRYGLIVPESNILPTTGWNFKRAARVALLIGADGGVYGDVSGHDIVGSLGTWNLDPVAGMPKTTYVAITGLDIYTPDYEKVEGKVNLPDVWDLQLQNLNAYGLFTVTSDSSCFNDGLIQHNETVPGGTVVQSDTVINASSTCMPNFWVDASTTDGQVYTRNDLNVGMTAGDGSPMLRLGKDGVIQQAEGIVIDEKGRLVSKKLETAVGNLDADERYVVDPAYTSTMNDIRLASRGGAKLSEILPNYILKEVKAINGSGNVDIPVCPQDYRAALVITPVSWDNTLSRTGGASMAEFPVTGNTTGVSGKVTVEELNKETNVNITQGSITNGKANLSTLKVSEGICVEISSTYTGVKDGDTPSATLGASKWNYKLGYKNTEASCTANNTVHAVAQSYCVFQNSDVPSEERYTDSTSCQAAYLTWNVAANRCQSKYDTVRINTMPTTNSEEKQRKKSMCLVSGGTWTQSSLTCNWP